MKSLPTYSASVYVGLREGYGDIVHDISEVRKLCQKYCDEVSYAFSLTKTEFIYKNGNEPGVIVGLIDYPRIPLGREIVRNHAIAIAKILMKELSQFRVSIVCPDETMMLEVEDLV